MNDELALLRRIAANPYDRGGIGAYADWLDERGRAEEAAVVRRQLACLPPATPGGQNTMTVAELIGQLLEMPLDAVVLYQACSQPNPLHSDDVTLVRAEDRKLVFREQNGYMDYDERWFLSDEELAQHQHRRYAKNIYKGEVPRFVTAVCFPGN